MISKSWSVSQSVSLIKLFSDFPFVRLEPFLRDVKATAREIEPLLAQIAENNS